MSGICMQCEMMQSIKDNEYTSQIIVCKSKILVAISIDQHYFHL